MMDDTVQRTCLEAIGSTPMVELSRMFDESQGRVLAKLEGVNPGGSKTDRVALQILRDARRDGRLAPHQTVVELTGGNTAVGLAMCCAVLGHPFIAVMSRTAPAECSLIVEAYGGEVVLLDAPEGARRGLVTPLDMEVAEAEVERIVRQRGAFRADPVRSLASFRAHRLGTGPEILRQTGGRFDTFCDFVGSGGTLAGCSAAFKEQNPSIRTYAVEPEGAAVLAGEQATRRGHAILGGGFQRTDLQLLNRERIDGYLQVSDEEAELEARRLGLQEGILTGWAGGANVAAARKLLEGRRHGETIVVVLPDTGLRYLSTSLWSGERRRSQAESA